MVVVCGQLGEGAVGVNDGVFHIFWYLVIVYCVVFVVVVVEG